MQLLRENLNHLLSWLFGNTLSPWLHHLQGMETAYCSPSSMPLFIPSTLPFTQCAAHGRAPSIFINKLIHISSISRRNLGVTFDRFFTLNARIKSLVHLCFYHFKSIKKLSQTPPCHALNWTEYFSCLYFIGFKLLICFDGYYLNKTSLELWSLHDWQTLVNTHISHCC